MPLFVVMTNLPGPGARALLKTAQDEGRVTGVDEEVLATVDEASEFVELEDEHGAGVGSRSGVTWTTEESFLSDKKLVKLGPFEPPITRARLDAVKQTLANVGAPTHDSSGAELNANGRLVDWLAGKRSEGWIGTEGQTIDELRAVLGELVKATDAWTNWNDDDPALPAWDDIEVAVDTAVEKARPLLKAVTS